MWSTSKKVEIKDSGLACVAKIGYVLVLLYIVLFEMLYRGSHLEVVPVIGVNQLRFEHPTLNSCDATEEGCLDNFSSRHTKPYCQESTLNYTFDKKTCKFWTAQEAEVQDGDGVALTTRVRVFNATRQCLDTYTDAHIDCPHNKLWDFKQVHDWYIMDVDRFWIWMEHSMTGGRDGLSASSTELNGRWWSCDSQPCQFSKLMPLPDEWGTVRGSVDEQSTLQSFDSSAQASTRDSRKTSSLLESKASAAQTKSSMVRTEVSATGSQSFMAKSRSRSRLSTRRHAASTPNSANTLKSAGNVKDEVFVFSRPGTHTKSQVDVFPMEYILGIANVDLDAAYKSATHRIFGVVITLTVTYKNTQADAFDFVGLRIFPWSMPLRTRLPWDPTGSTRARYDINVSANSQGYMHLDKDNYRKLARSYSLWKMNGIYIDVAQGGEMLVWSWPKLAVYITTAVGLISVAFHLTRLWASRQKPLQNLMVERYVARDDSGEYERVDSYDDPP
eukprot:TRINITY_DN13389_c3_g1_i1.p1 TRINITY_DN13389_c3_g1~~TRINITY_DN13389_c3_g1_i1.p1  ORF type:complete len:501 (+),score=25.60 TRINITY_DN13389_c3_g1_i1:53-1555(+)